MGLQINHVQGIRKVESRGPDLMVPVQNVGSNDATDVHIEGSSPNVTVHKRFIERISPDDSRTLRLTTTLQGERARVTFNTTYDVGLQIKGRELEVNTGRIDITGVSVTREDKGGLETVVYALDGLLCMLLSVIMIVAWRDRNVSC